jgi:hypothetical protein
MPDDTPLKSAYELAMERLRQKDEAEGVTASKPLRAAQKARISELRRDAKAKLAEMEILHLKNLAAAGGDPEKIRDLEEKYRIDRARIESRMEDEIAKVHRGK